MDLFLILTTFSCFYMTGVIWIVQLNTYPQFLNVPEEFWPDFHLHHMKSITFVVAPAMLLEVFTAAVLLLNPEIIQKAWLNYAQFGVVFLIWVVTAVIQIPQQHKLEKGYDRKTIVSLVQFNWIRTLLWTARSALLIFFFVTM